MIYLRIMSGFLREILSDFYGIYYGQPVRLLWWCCGSRNDVNDENDIPPLVINDAGIDVCCQTEDDKNDYLNKYKSEYYSLYDDEPGLVFEHPDEYPYYIPYYYSDEDKEDSEEESEGGIYYADVVYMHRREFAFRYENEKERDKIIATDKLRWKVVRQIVYEKEQMVRQAQRNFEEVLDDLFPEKGFMTARGALEHSKRAIVDPEILWINASSPIRFFWERIRDNSASVECDVAQRFGTVTSARASAERHDYLFDSGCSNTMSGQTSRVLANAEEESLPSKVKFGNGDELVVTREGINEDGVSEIVVPGMPTERTLLCANDYTQNGITILTQTGGAVYIDPSSDERLRLDEFLGGWKPWKTLYVKDKVYYMREPPGVKFSPPEFIEAAASQTKFFNSRISVTNVEELVQVYALMGFPLKSLRQSIKGNTIDGIDPRLTTTAINAFERKYGSNVDPFILASPWMRHGLINAVNNVPEKPTEIGHLEMDVFEMPFLSEIKDGKREPLSCLGGGRYLYLWIDKYSLCLGGAIATGQKNPVRMVDKADYLMYRQNGKKMVKLIADQGVNSQAMYQVGTGDVALWCQRHNVVIRLAEAYNHQNGTSLIENYGRWTKTFVRFMYQFYIRCPYIWQLGFNKAHIKLLWGEFGLHAININRLFPHPTIEGVSRIEAHDGRRGNIQNYRVLPPCVSLVLRRVGNSANLEDSHGHFWQYGLYCGGSVTVKGGARFAVISGDRLIVITTTSFTAVSEGGGSFTYPVIQKGIRLLNPKSIEDFEEEARQDKLDKAIEDVTEVTKAGGGILNAVKDVLCDQCGTPFTLPEDIVATIGEQGFVCSDMGATCNEQQIVDGGDDPPQLIADDSDDETDVVDELHVDPAGIVVGHSVWAKTYVNGARGQTFRGTLVRVDVEARTVDILYDDGDKERRRPWRMLRGFDETVERLIIDEDFLQQFDSVDENSQEETEKCSCRWACGSECTRGRTRGKSA